MKNLKKKAVLLLLATVMVLGGCMAKDTASNENISLEYDTQQSQEFGFTIKDDSGYPVEYTKVGGSFNTNGAAAIVSSNSNIKDIASLNKKIIKTGSLSLDVVNLDKVVDEIKVLVGINSAYIQSSSRNNYENHNRVNISIRVPVELFDTVYNEISELGEVTQDNTNAQDVTEEYFDLEIRLATLEAKRDSFTKLLDKAENVTEILQIENELNRVIYDIESVKGRMKYLDRNVAMSTINLIIYERNPASTIEKNFFERIKFAIKDGWGSMLNFIMNIVLTIVWILPFTPIILIVFFILRKIWLMIKARRDRKKNMQL